VFFLGFIFKEIFILYLPKDCVDIVLDNLRKYFIFSSIRFYYNEDYKFVFFKESIGNKFHYTLLLNHFFLKSVVLSTASFNVDAIISKAEVYTMNIHIFLPFMERNTSGKFLPSDLGSDKLNFFCFNKVCFMGQEIIARVKYLSKTKKISSYFLLGDDFACKKGKIYNSSGEYYGNVVNSVIYSNEIHVLAVLINRNHSRL